VKRFITVCLVSFMVLSISYAEEGKDQEGFWSKLRSKIESITPKKKSTVTTAVGGVRGAQDESAKVLYWKGKEIDEEISADELDKFKSALECAMNGNADESLKMFDEFIAQYPQSPLREDAVKAVESLKADE
jgi:TolA-binding protein